MSIGKNFQRKTAPSTSGGSSALAWPFGLIRSESSPCRLVRFRDSASGVTIFGATAGAARGRYKPAGSNRTCRKGPSREHVRVVLQALAAVQPDNSLPHAAP